MNRKIALVMALAIGGMALTGCDTSSTEATPSAPVAAPVATLEEDPSFAHCGDSCRANLASTFYTTKQPSLSEDGKWTCYHALICVSYADQAAYDQEECSSRKDPHPDRWTWTWTSDDHTEGSCELTTTSSGTSSSPSNDNVIVGGGDSSDDHVSCSWRGRCRVHG